MSVAELERHSPAADTGFPETWYGISSEDHFWFRWRMQAFQDLLSGLPIRRDEPLRVLEIGCGTGVLRRQVEAGTTWTVDGADLNQAALEQNGGTRGRTLLYNILDQKEEFRNRYDVVILFDVIEHIADTDAFLRAAFMHLKPGGWMIVNVPALGLLYSKFDACVGHLRRYDKRSLEKELATGGLGRVARVRYWGVLLIPLGVLRKLVLAFVQGRENVVRAGLRPPSRLLNEVLTRAMSLEGMLFTNPSIGTSVLAAVQATEPGDAR